MIIYAGAVKPDDILIDVTFRARVGEWKELRKAILALDEDNKLHKDITTGLHEPFWSIVYRLDTVIEAIEKQHSNYGG